MNKLDYWKKCISSAFDEHGISATVEQIEAAANDLQNSSDNIGLAFFEPEHPATFEIEKLKSELKFEKALIHCETCSGRGRLIENFGTFSSNSECYKCYGKGKHQ